MVCSEDRDYFYNVYFTQNYTVTSEFFTSGVYNDYWTWWGYYGFSEFLFSSDDYSYLYTADYYYQSAFRFIAANENGGMRYSVGDTIDMFFLDYQNSEFEENADFELLGAAKLAAGGAALLMAVLM
jgi:hypothetical protein